MLDHLLWATPDLEDGIRNIAALTGVTAAFGGRHVGVGTHNALLDLEGRQYLEIIASDPLQDSYSGFGLLLQDLKIAGLMTWAARSDNVDATAAAARAAGLEPAEIVDMSRRRPDGTEFAWRILQIEGHPWGPLLPFFIQWRGDNHPCDSLPNGCRLQSFEVLCTQPEPLREVFSALSLDTPVYLAKSPGLRAVLETPRGEVVLREL